MPPYTIEEAKEQPITLYWWNYGKKTLDFKGTYTEYFAEKEFTVTEIPQSPRKGTKIEFSASTTTVTIESVSNDAERDFNDAIKTYLMLLGDKALFETNRQSFRINWE